MQSPIQKQTAQQPVTASYNQQSASAVSYNGVRTGRGGSWVKWLLIGACITGMYLVGVAVGQGRLSLSTIPRPARDTTSASLPYEEVNQVYQALRNNYDGTLSNEAILNGLKHGLARSTGDPYTEFFSAEESKDFANDLQGTITGIGAKLEQDDEGNVVIVAPIAGSPAESAGIRAKDIIFAIDDKPTTGMSATEAVLKIRGKKGTSVKLGILRGQNDQKERLDLTIVRDIITVPSVTTKTLDGNIGYIQVSQFSDDADERATKAATDFKQAGVQGIILDLRDNPGGEVSSAINLSSLWLDKGAVVLKQKRGRTVTDTNYATGNAVLKGVPTVVLVNSGSASASEITALALRDAGAATIIGSKTYGKGVVQQLIPFDDGSSLKVTIGKWYSPKDTNIDKKGVTPDKEVKMTDQDYKDQNDVQLKAATDFLTK
jgi:carboxyl-terminal processing protease